VTVRSGQISKHAEVAGICAPGRDFQPAKRVRVQPDRQLGRFLITEPFDPKASTELAQCRSESFKTLLGPQREAVEILGRSLRAMRDRGHSANQQVSHTEAVQRLHQAVQVGVSPSSGRWL
jgi:hypothetical protein